MSTVALTQRTALVRHPEDRKWFEAMPGESIAYRVRSEEVGGAYALVEGLLPPLSGPPLHIHENEDEVFEILEGSLRFVCNGETFDASAGTLVVIPKGTPHTWRNLTDAPARTLVFLTPGGAEGMFEEFANKPVEELEAIASRYGTRFVGPPIPIEGNQGQ